MYNKTLSSKTYLYLYQGGYLSNFFSNVDNKGPLTYCAMFIYCSSLASIHYS